MSLSRIISVSAVAMALVSCGLVDATDLQIGDHIIAALERYRGDHGIYPQTLEQLVPRYIPAITPPRHGARKWDYVTYRGCSDFALFYRGSQPYMDHYAYGAPEKKWQLVNNSF